MRRVGSLVFTVGVLAAAVFAPPVEEERDLVVRCIDASGADRACAPEFARVSEPAREDPELAALLHDFAYAAAEAGPEGCGWLLCGLAAIVLVFGLWSRGFRCALRRVMLTFALGVPLGIYLVYASSFLDGRRIVLGPEARDEVACSLHAQTDRTTGLLSPRAVVKWHAQRGFRVLNVSDKDQVAAGHEARLAARTMDLTPSMLVLVGEEWHGSPDLVLLNVKRAWRPRQMPIHPQNVKEKIEEVVDGVQGEGGAVFLAHPWSKIPETVTLEDVLEAGVDGIEIVNGVIHGGTQRIRLAREYEKALVGVIDYKYGPHVNALTLLPAATVLTRSGEPSAAGVVRALRNAQTKVLYAVPGGARTGAEYAAADLGVTGAMAGLRTLQETPLRRRAVWFGWLAGIAILWWLAQMEHDFLWRAVFRRERKRREGVGVRGARILFVACCVAEYVLAGGLGWQVREAVALPVPVLLAIAAAVAVPLLASSVVLSRAERRR